MPHLLMLGVHFTFQLSAIVPALDWSMGRAQSMHLNGKRGKDLMEICKANFLRIEPGGIVEVHAIATFKSHSESHMNRQGIETGNQQIGLFYFCMVSNHGLCFYIRSTSYVSLTAINL